MSRFWKLLLGGCLFSSLVACGAKNESEKAIDDAKRRIDQVWRDDDRSGGDAVRASAAARDAISPGGQPGRVSLTGALVKSENELDPRISVTQVSGMGWRGSRPEVRMGALHLKVKLPPSADEAIENLKSDHTFINLGCETNGRSEISGLKLQPVFSTDTAFSALKAKVILICDPKLLQSHIISFISFIGEVVVLSDFKFEQLGAVDKGFSILARELVLEKTSVLSSKGKAASVTLVEGPSIAISASRLTGSGKLEIKAEGANFEYPVPFTEALH